MEELKKAQYDEVIADIESAEWKTAKPTKEAFEDAVEDIYHAIRHTFGYGDQSEYLMDWFDEMVDAWEFNHKQKLQ